MDEKVEQPQLGPVVIKLMRGVVYRDRHEAVWPRCIAHLAIKHKLIHAAYTSWIT